MLLSIFVFSTAIFTGATFAWATGKTQKLFTKLVSAVIAMLCFAFWMVMGVNAEELVLVFLPQCISMGIICTAFSTCRGKCVELEEGKLALEFDT
jgi:hypothetical protein